MNVATADVGERDANLSEVVIAVLTIQVLDKTMETFVEVGTFCINTHLVHL